MSMNFIFICLRSLHLFIIILYKDVIDNTCSFENLSINPTEVSKLKCRQNLSTDRQKEKHWGILKCPISTLPFAGV